MCIASVFAAVALLLAVSLLGMFKGRMGDRSTVVFVRNFSWDQLLDLYQHDQKAKASPASSDSQRWSVTAKAGLFILCGKMSYNSRSNGKNTLSTL